MGFVLGLLAALILALLCGYFSFLNQTPVQVNFPPPIPPQHAFLHEIILLPAIVGALISFCALAAPLLGARRTARALRRQMRALEEQLKALREAPAPAPLYSGNSSALAPAHPSQVARSDEEPV
jgi:uncharacterized integral membrane protein